MADNKDTEQTAASSEPADKPSIPVKKKTAKKSVAKKKVAKKKTASKKAAAKQPETAPTPAERESDAGLERPTASPRSEAVVKAKFEPPEPAEENAMSSESKSSGVFWVKVIVWLLIIVFIFMLIRSLAKQAGEQPTGMTGEASQEAAPATTIDSARVEQARPGSPAAASRAANEGQAPVSERDQRADASSADQAAGTAPVSAGPATDIPAGAYDRPATMPQAGEGAARPGGREDARAQRDESVAKILQEFDDLREAARAEMEAMRNLIQAERELREAIMAPRQPPAYPGWRAPGSTQDPYAPAPQYPRY